MTTATYAMAQTNVGTTRKTWRAASKGYSSMLVTEESEDMLHLHTPVGLVHLTRDGGLTFTGSYKGKRIIFLDAPEGPVLIFWKD